MKTPRAFTLIEVLTVVAIIAILAAILFPVLAVARRRAFLSQDVSQMRQIYDAIVLYESDNDDMSPASLDLLPHYTKSRALFASPVDPFRGGAPGYVDFPADPPCVNDPRRSTFRFSYGYLKSMMDCRGFGEFFPRLRRDSTWSLLVNWMYNDPYELTDRSDVDVSRAQRVEYRIRSDGSFATWHNFGPYAIGCGSYTYCFGPEGGSGNSPPPESSAPLNRW